MEKLLSIVVLAFAGAFLALAAAMVALGIALLIIELFSVSETLGIVLIGVMALGAVLAVLLVEDGR